MDTILYNKIANFCLEKNKDGKCPDYKSIEDITNQPKVGIKDLEFPETCWECEFQIQSKYDKNDRVCYFNGKNCIKGHTVKFNDCPLVKLD